MLHRKISFSMLNKQQTALNRSLSISRPNFVRQCTRSHRLQLVSDMSCPMFSAVLPKLYQRFDGSGLTEITKSRLLLVCTALLMISTVGCVRRRMTVRTSPPGATISVDNQVIGTSPAASSFTYYGTREFRIEKDGFKTETIRRKFNPPWYQWPGLDFVSETLWPGEIRDERIIDVQLSPRTFEATEDVVSRADTLRGQASSGIVTGPRR